MWMSRLVPKSKITAVLAIALSFTAWGAGFHARALAKHRKHTDTAVATKASDKDFESQLQKCLSDIEYDRPFSAQLDALLIRLSKAESKQRQHAEDKLASALTVLSDQQIDQRKFTEAARNLERVKRVMNGRKHGYWPATIAAANLAAKNSNHQKAIDLYNAAIHAMHEQGVKNTRDEAVANFLLGDLYESKGWNQQAEQVYRRSLTIFSHIKSDSADSDACMVLRLCTQLTALRQKLKYPESSIVDSLNSALQAANRIKGKESKDDLWVLDKLASCCKVQKRQKDFEVLNARKAEARRRLHSKAP